LSEAPTFAAFDPRSSGIVRGPGEDGDEDEDDDEDGN